MSSINGFASYTEKYKIIFATNMKYICHKYINIFIANILDIIFVTYILKFFPCSYGAEQNIFEGMNTNRIH